MASKTSIKRAAKELKDLATYVQNKAELADKWLKDGRHDQAAYHLATCRQALDHAELYAEIIDQEILKYWDEKLGGAPTI